MKNYINNYIIFRKFFLFFVLSVQLFAIPLYHSQEFLVNNYGHFVLSEDKKSFYSFDPFSYYQLKLIDINTTKVVKKFRYIKDVNLTGADEKILEKLPYKLDENSVWCVDRAKNIIYHSTRYNEIVAFDLQKQTQLFKTKTLFEISEYSRITALKLGKDGSKLICGFDKNLVEFDIQTQRYKKFSEVSISVNALDISDDFHYIVATALSNGLYVYDYDTLKLIKKLETEAYGLKESLHSSINTVAFVDNDKLLYASSLEGVALLSISSGKVLRRYTEKKHSPSFGIRGDMLYVFTTNASVYHYNLKTQKFQEVYKLPLKNIKRVVSAQGDEIMLSQRDGKFIYYDMQKNSYKDYHTSFRDHFTASFAQHPTKRWFARMSSNNALQVFDVESSKEIVRIEREFFDMPDVFSFLDEKVMIYSSDTCGFEKKPPLYFIDINSKRLFSKTEHLDTVLTYRKTKDSKHLLTLSYDRTLKLWDLNLKYPSHTKVLDTHYVGAIPVSMGLSEDESKMVIATREGGVYLYALNLKTHKFGKLLKVLKGKAPTGIKTQRKRTDDEQLNGWKPKNTITYTNFAFYDNDTKLIMEDPFANLIFYDIKANKEIYKLLFFAQRDWVKLYPYGVFESSRNGHKYIDANYYKIFEEDEKVLFDANESIEEMEDIQQVKKKESPADDSISWWAYLIGIVLLYKGLDTLAIHYEHKKAYKKLP